jgi:hypothetical protein
MTSASLYKLPVTVADIVLSIAQRHGIDTSEDGFDSVADHISSLCDYDGDDTLRLIADLMREGVLSPQQGTALTLAHVRELAPRH